MSVAASTVTLGGHAGPLLRLGFGCEQLGGHAWGASDRAELEAAVVRAAELGIRLFDTADCYGLGESESRLGRLLAPFRTDALIATKFGVRFDAAGKVYYDASPAWARTAIDESLRRLGIDCIDLYQLHYPDGVTPYRIPDIRRNEEIRDSREREIDLHYRLEDNLAPSRHKSFKAIRDRTSKN